MDTMNVAVATWASGSALGRMLAPERAPEQPPLIEGGRAVVSAVVGTLALGGAERIVLDWAASCTARYRVCLVVLRRVEAEWPLPRGVEVLRLDCGDPERELEAVGADIAASGNAVVLCHLLTTAERSALARGGAYAVPVVHNAAAGWTETASALSNAPCVIAVSRRAATELQAAGCRAPCSVIHHIPPTPAVRSAARQEWRARWALPQDAVVIGMIGAVKPQKAYPRALRVLAALLDRRDAYLVIVGGRIGRDGALAWGAVLAQAQRLGIEDRVRLPGFVPHAADCLPAFDLLLNTSRYEGLSIATLEALAGGLPVVASAVGGQGEIPAPGLTLVAPAAPDDDWASAVDAALERRPPPPEWRGVSTHRLWTLFHLLQPYNPESGVLFVTANLNAGGAQRSLVNLTIALKGSMRFEIAVCGESSSDHFTRRLAQAQIKVFRTAASRDCFDHAEAILRCMMAGRFRTVCFWNIDAKVKLLVVKALGATDVRLIDVSPGGYSFEEMRATSSFQRWFAYTADEYYARLDRLVLKYGGAAPPMVRSPVTVIPNGVPVRVDARGRSALAAQRIVMSGRIAPSKFLVEAVAAMRLLWRAHPDVELHLLGSAEPRHAAYAREVVEAIGTELDRRVFLHGAVFDAPERVAEFSVALVLGEHQGCPNAVLEALAAGVPVIANDSGGTRELVIDGRTGILVPGVDPRELAAALVRLIGDPGLAQRLADAGRRHVVGNFSMVRMAAAYRKLFKAS